jgi:hypothetical protein
MSSVWVDEIRDQTGSTTIAPSIPALNSKFSKGWVNFNGQGTIAIRDESGTDGLVDDGTGVYTVNWTDVLSANNCPVPASTTGQISILVASSAAGTQVSTTDSSGVAQDSILVTLSVFSN